MTNYEHLLIIEFVNVYNSLNLFNLFQNSLTLTFFIDIKNEL